MPELGPMMRALELQRLIENKVTEWRERSARVAGTSVADSYQQPLHFKRHINRRKNSTEINRIIAKYSRPNKRTDEHRFTLPRCPEEPPVRPARQKKPKTHLKASKSEDNLVNIGVMETPDPKANEKVHQRFIFSKYNTKSCEDISAFVDVGHTMKSKNFEANSILNAKSAPSGRHTLHSICEDVPSIADFEDSGIDFRHNTSNFVTSTPITNRKTCPPGDSVLMLKFNKCFKYNSVSELKKGISEPDILSQKSVDSGSTLDIRRRWKLIKPPFRKGSFDCILRWRGKKPQANQSR